MGSEHFISYFSYYAASFMWGLFFRRFAVPTLLIVLVWHYMIYGLIVGADRFKDAEFHYWLPLTAILGVMMGYIVAGLLNLRRVIFWKRFDLYGCWLPAVLLEFTMFHGVLAIWETTGTFVRPVNFIVTLIGFIVLIPLWYFLTSGFTVWAYWDESNGKLSYADRAALKFHGVFALFQISACIIFTATESANSAIWPFWIMLGTFGFHILLWFMISLFIINSNATVHHQYKKIRDNVTSHLSRVPGTSTGFSWPWSSPDRRSETAIEMEMAETGQVPQGGGQQKKKRNNGGGGGPEYQKLHEIK